MTETNVQKKKKKNDVNLEMKCCQLKSMGEKQKQRVKQKDVLTT